MPKKVFINIVLFTLSVTTLLILCSQLTYVRENTYLANIDIKYGPFLYFTTALIVLFLLYNIYLLLQHTPPKITTIILLLLIFLIQIVYIFLLRPVPYADPFSVAYYAKTGIKENLSYYLTFPTQLPITMLISTYYKILEIAGITDLLSANAVLAAICTDISIYFSYKVALKILVNRSIAQILLVFALVNPNTYLWGTYLYTHVVSMMLMTISIYIILCIKDTAQLRKVILLSVLLAVVSYVGMSIRCTAIFSIIALIICCILNSGFLKKKNLLYIVISFILAFLLSHLTMDFLKSSFLSKCGMSNFYEESIDLAFPLIYALLIGVSAGTGFDCMGYVASFATHGEKVSGICIKIAEILGDRNVAEWIEFKLKSLWGIGDSWGWYGLNNYRNYEGAAGGIYHAIVGDDAGIFFVYSQSFCIVIFALILLLIIDMIGHEQKISDKFLVLLIFGGALLYHVISETQPSYSFTWYSIVIILMTLGFEKFLRLWDKVNQYISDSSQPITRYSTYCCVLVIFFTIWNSWYLKKPFTETDISHVRYAAHTIESNKTTGGGGGDKTDILYSARI